MADSFDKVVEALEEHEEGRRSQTHYVSEPNRQAAVAAHELFMMLLAGGFTETQAAKVIAARMVMEGDEEEG